MRLTYRQKRNLTGRMNTWQQDSAYGDKMVDKILEILEITQYRKMEGYFKEFDVICVKGKDIVLREMKADRWMAKTGNIAVEVFNRGKPSGISTSRADYWSIYSEELNELYDIPMKVLKDCIDRQKYSELKSCGEDSFCYLFKKDLFAEYLVLQEVSLPLLDDSNDTVPDSCCGRLRR